MGFQKLRHLMEQFGEVGRVYLAPEAIGARGLMSPNCQCGTLHPYTLWLCQNSYWKWSFIVDFPIKNGGSFYSYVSHYQRVSTYHLLAKMNLFDQSIRRSTNRMLLLLVYTLLKKPCFVPMVSAGEDQAPDTRRCIKNCFLDVPLALVSPCCCTLFDCDILRVME